jgi:glycosyltransferase involved in cell wall biosynthesis
MKQKKCLFFYPVISSFVSNDLDILKREFRVSPHRLALNKNPLLFALGFLKILVISLIRIPSSHVVYIWFADYHSFLPVLIAKVFRKKSYVVIGGYDVARIPAFNYGSHMKGFRSFCAKYSMQHASASLTVSKYVDRKVKYIAPRAKRILIPNGVSFNHEITEATRENMILSVAVINSYNGYRIKGIDFLLKIAQQMPDTPFTIIGADKAEISKYTDNIPDNVSLLGLIPHDQLVAYFLKAKVYCQFSLSESFGLALAEAMYFGCWPVVCNNTALPEMVGDAGQVINCKQMDKVVSSIRYLLDHVEVNTKAREVILSKYTLDIRRKKLISLLST